MTYENLVKEAVKAVKPVDTTIIKEHLAVEFDIEGKAEGAFYVEFSAAKVEVEPYEYYDHDFRIRTDAASALKILSGELDPEVAVKSGEIRVEGNEYKVGLLKKYLAADVATEKKAKKSPSKKPATAKKSDKPTAKKPGSKATKAARK